MNRLFTFIATALIFWAGNLTKVKAEIMNKEIQLVQDWDKTFPKSEKVKRLRYGSPWIAHQAC